MNRDQRRTLGMHTVEIAERGWYEAADGRRVEIAEHVKEAVAGTVHYTGEALDKLVGAAQWAGKARTDGRARFEVRNETTLAAARRLMGDGRGDVAALNFASAWNPGGGFLSGANAQEESIARASALYPCLTSRMELYERNREHRSALYLDDMIYSPRVPVFREDDGALLPDPYRLSIITSPAVNRTRLSPREHEAVARAMRRRAEKVLAVAAAHGHRTLILGAWGCGVFGNEPAHVAEWFYEHLCENARFAGAFEHVTFAVLDHSADQRVVGSFRQRFG